MAVVIVDDDDDDDIVFVQDISFLFIGGLMMAVAIQETNLHRRISLMVLLTVGAEPSRLLAGWLTDWPD